MIEGRLDDDTQMGLDVIRYGFYVTIVLYVISGLFFLYWSSDPVDDPSSIGCFLCFFPIILVILYLVGIYKLYKGSKKVSFDHERNVNIAVVLIILGFIFGLASPSLNFNSIEAFRHSMMVSSGLEMVQQICYVLAFIYLVIDLAKKKARNYLYVGASLLWAVFLFRVIWSIFFIPSEGELVDVVLTSLRMLSVVMLVIAVGYFFMSMGYKKATYTQEKKSETDSEEELFKEVCPNCNSKEFTRYSDGSGFCEYCGRIATDEEEHLEKQDIE